MKLSSARQHNYVELSWNSFVVRKSSSYIGLTMCRLGPETLHPKSYKSIKLPDHATATKKNTTEMAYFKTPMNALQRPDKHPTHLMT